MKNSGAPREVRIELLRARAAVERQSMVYNAHSLRAGLTPSNLLKSMLPRSLSGGGGKSASDFLLKGVRMARQYPFLISGGSAVLARVGLRRKWWRIGALLLTLAAARRLSGARHGGSAGE